FRRSQNAARTEEGRTGKSTGIQETAFNVTLDDGGSTKRTSITTYDKLGKPRDERAPYTRFDFAAPPTPGQDGVYNNLQVQRPTSENANAYEPVSMSPVSAAGSGGPSEPSTSSGRVSAIYANVCGGAGSLVYENTEFPRRK
ncbi:hypothetical protein BaRGS_00030194, partial [Batillaria attramentaria]